MIERLGVGQNGSFSRFDLHSFDGHSDIDDVSLPPLGHRHCDDVMLPSEVVPYHRSDAIGRNWNIWIKVLDLEINWGRREERYEARTCSIQCFPVGVWWSCHLLREIRRWRIMSKGNM